MRRVLMLVMLLVWVPSCAAREGPAKPLFDPARHMRVSEVKPGMKGYGLTVFKGTTIEKFDVEVVSVLKNFNPQSDVVLITCSGHNLEHTGAVGGMSGSPIFLTDEQGRERMIGAFAYGFPLAKDPIAGVQPIEYMLDLPDPKPGEARKGQSSAAPKRGSWSVFEASALLNRPPHRARSGEDRRLLTPVMAAGLSAEALASLSPLLGGYGLVPLQSGGASGAADPASDTISPGSVLVSPILTGDSELVAVGTCTEVIGQRVFAFGHPFNGEGAIDLPMGSGQVNAIIATLTNSFKIGSMSKLAGTLTMDQAYGVAGRLGEAPSAIPIELKVIYNDGSLDRTYRFEAVRHPQMTQIALATAITGALTGTRALPQYHTVDFDLNIEFANGRVVRSTDVVVNDAALSVLQAAALPVLAASENPFERTTLRKLNGTIRITGEARNAQVLSINLAKLKYRAGETVSADVVYRPFRGEEKVLPVQMALPHDIAPGNYQLIISDAARCLQDEQTYKPFRFRAESINEVFDALGELQSFKNNALYLRLLRKADGVAIGRTSMRQLPSSRRDVLLGAGRSNITAFVSSEVNVVPTDLVMTGAAEFTITIESAGKVEVGASGGKPEAADPKGSPEESGNDK